MISVLVCSVRPGLYQQLAKNIEQTIGVDYELLCYDNRENNKGLCEVYNILAKDAKYKVLCFVHEDIVFTTNQWGKILLNIFSESNNMGVVGVAGSKYKSLTFSGWFTGIQQFDCANIIHQFPNRQEKIFLQPVKDKTLEDVVCLDGVFISCTRNVWNEIRFDQQRLKGFHFYDIDFSLRAAKAHTVAVTYEIDIIHITHGGDFGNRWVETAFNYHQKNRELLPFTREENVPGKTEILIAKTNLDLLKTFRISFKNKLKWVWLQKLWFHPVLYYDMLKFFLYQPLGLKFIHNLFKPR